MNTEKKDLIVTLTTIPPRMSLIEPTLRSLLNQSANIKAIHLYIPKKYRRQEFSGYEIPAYPEGVEVIYVDFDYGPATKVLPAISLYRDKDVYILFCDDDLIYDREWAQRFVEMAEKSPKSCICERALRVSALEARNYRANHPIKYRLKRIFSLGLWRPTKKMNTDLVDVFEGYGGVLVEPAFFDDEAFDIPDVLWTVDDVWLSGHVTKNGIPIVVNHRSVKANAPIRAESGKVANLKSLIYQGHGRISADLSCVKYYQDTYGIWKA